MVDEDPLDRLAEQLESIESRIARIELKVDRAIVALRPGLLWRLRPKHSLWRFAQHRPRPVSTPGSYSAQHGPAEWPELTIGIVTPSFNHADFVGATIDSVLNQGCPHLSYVVQDGSSTDRTLDLLKTYGSALTWRSEPDDGQAQAINLGFVGVESEIMAYLNSDDILLPGALFYVARYFAAHPEVDLLYGHRVNIDAAGLEIGRAVLPQHDPEVIKWADYIPQETMFWRRRVWEAVGGIDETFRFAMDWDFILRAQQAGFRLVRVPRFLACFRIHQNQKSSAMMHVGQEEMERLREAHLGRVPNQFEIREKIKPYLVRQVLHQWAYRMKLLRG